jgi:hypothetical protein
LHEVIFICLHSKPMQVSSDMIVFCWKQIMLIALRFITDYFTCKPLFPSNLIIIIRKLNLQFNILSAGSSWKLACFHSHCISILTFSFNLYL